MISSMSGSNRTHRWKIIKPVLDGLDEENDMETASFLELSSSLKNKRISSGILVDLFILAGFLFYKTACLFFLFLLYRML